VKARVRRPIRLKAMHPRSAPELAAMQADLEGRSSARSKARAIWTRAFLASGKPGKP
jgi:hypothetical protein